MHALEDAQSALLLVEALGSVHIGVSSQCCNSSGPQKHINQNCRTHVFTGILLYPETVCDQAHRWFLDTLQKLDETSFEVWGSFRVSPLTHHL